MKDAVTKTYRFLLTLFDEQSGGELILQLSKRDPAPRWDDPKLE